MSGARRMFRLAHDRRHMDHPSQSSTRPHPELPSGDAIARVGNSPPPPLIPPAVVNTPAFRAELARRVRMYHEDMETDRAQLFRQLRLAGIIAGAAVVILAIAMAIGALRLPF